MSFTTLLPWISARGRLSRAGWWRIRRRPAPWRGSFVPRLDLLEDRTLLSWAPIGPAPILNGQTPGNQPVTGRVAAVAGDPIDPNTLYVAASGGGVWKTIDGGASWTPLTDNEATLKMGALAVAPSDPNVIYAGTGEANFSGDSFYGRGVLKSTDGGATWTLLGTTQFGRRTISQIAVSPTDPNLVYLTVNDSGVNGLSGNTGVWKSSNGGLSWTNTTTSISTSQPFTDVVIADPSGNTLYAAVGQIFGSSVNGVYKSTNGGASWSLVGNGLPSGFLDGRIRVAVPTGSFLGQTSVVYASISGSGSRGSTLFGSLFRVMRSDDGGTTWTDVTPSINYMGGQGWYDTTLAVDPNNPMDVYVGGQIRILETSNAGLSWFDISTGGDGIGPHVDHHGIGFDAQGRLLDGNDGGIWRLDNPDSFNIHWSDLNGNPGTGLQLTTFVGIAQDPSNPDILYGGSQDNGREKYTGGLAWNLVRFGDGGYIRVDPVTPTTVYGEFAGTSLERSRDGGLTWVNASPPFFFGNFYQPYVIDPTNHNRLVYGNSILWESLDQGTTWNPLGIPFRNGFNVFFANIDAVATNGTATYASAGGDIYVTTNGGANWFRRDVPGLITTVPALLADPDPAFPGIAFAVHNQFSTGQFNIGKVFFTDNFGGTWSDITGNLPAAGNDDLPAWSLAFDPSGGGTLYVGTDNGVYVSTSPGVWSALDTGLPHAEVTGLELATNLNLLDAGTYGRGVFRLNLAGTKPPAGTQVNDPVKRFQRADLRTAAQAAVLFSSLSSSGSSPGWSVRLPGQAVTSPGDEMPMRRLDLVSLDQLFASHRAGKGVARADSGRASHTSNGGLTDAALLIDIRLLALE